MKYIILQQKIIILVYTDFYLFFGIIFDYKLDKAFTSNIPQLKIFLARNELKNQRISFQNFSQLQSGKKGEESILID